MIGQANWNREMIMVPHCNRWVGTAPSGKKIERLHVADLPPFYFKVYKKKEIGLQKANGELNIPDEKELHRAFKFMEDNGLDVFDIRFKMLYPPNRSVIFEAFVGVTE